MSENNCAYPALMMDKVMDMFDNTVHGKLDPINFGKGTSSFNPFSHIDFHLSRTELGKHISYGDIAGLESLRQAICRYYQEKFDYDLTPDRVCITDGASGAMTIALAMLLEDGGEVILPASRYPAYNVMVRILKAGYRLAPMRDEGYIDVECLPQLISDKTRAIIINSPSNPHGTFLCSDELEYITSMGVPVIFDEVYQSLPLLDETIPSAIHFTNQHIVVSSLSKSLAIAGFRIGYLIVPESQVQLMTNVKAILNMCTSLPSQIVANHLLHYWDELISKHRAMLRDNWSFFSYTAQNLGFKLRLQPEAGFFALIDITKSCCDTLQASLDLARYYALSSTPGIDFQDHDHGFLRLNFACPKHHIETGLTRLSRYLDQVSAEPETN